MITSFCVPVSGFMRTRPFQAPEEELGMRLAALTHDPFFSLYMDVIQGSSPLTLVSGKKTDGR